MAAQTTIALVTGGNRGIGLAVCRQLAAQGMTVILGSRDGAKGEHAAATIHERGKVISRTLDVTDQASIDRLRDETAREFGRLDVLVNNAAILYDSWERASNVDLKNVFDAFDTNTIGAWRMIQTFLPLMRRSNHGRIVNVSSEAGSLASMGSSAPAYNVSKVALNALTVMFARELRGSGILVNSVCPGWVATDMGGSGGRPVEDGAASVVWAVNLPDNGPTGGFYRDGRPIDW